MQARLFLRSDEEKRAAHALGIEDFSRIYTMEDMAKGDVIFAATGITDGSMLNGIKFRGNEVTSHTVVMRSITGTIRWVQGRHIRVGKFA